MKVAQSQALPATTRAHREGSIDAKTTLRLAREDAHRAPEQDKNFSK